MAILAECPICRKKQSVKNRLCSCGEDLVKAKRSKRIRYWIDYLMSNGKARREAVGYSIEEARTAEGKRKVQRYENPRILEKAPEVKMTFRELSEWHLEQESVKSLAYYDTLSINLNSFNVEFGDMIVSQIKPADLKNYQAKRKASGYSDSYVDQEISAAKTVINRAFDNDLVGGETVKAFRKVKKLLKRNANARKKILSLDQFNQLLNHLPLHTKAILTAAFYTGMRRDEILSLTWDKVDLKNRVIRLEATDTKDKEPRITPIGPELYELLNQMPRSLNNGHVFLYRGKPIKDIRTALMRGCREAGIPYGRFVKDGFVFHDLRHTFNTYMRKAGVSESVIMEITGHSTREMFDRYNTVDSEDAKRANEQLRDYLLKSLDQNLDQDHTQKKKEVSLN